MITKLCPCRSVGAIYDSKNFLNYFYSLFAWFQQIAPLHWDKSLCLAEMQEPRKQAITALHGELSLVFNRLSERHPICIELYLAELVDTALGSVSLIT
jgi:hypothetical protein